MIDLEIFFIGLFLGIDITHARLIVFGLDNRARMVLNNPDGIYDDAIEATEVAANNLNAIIHLKKSDKGTRIGATSNKGIARTNIEVYIGNKIGVARDKFGGRNDPRFKATFPDKMKGFYKVQETDFSTNVAVLIAKAHQYTLVLGPEIETNLTILYNIYTQASSTQMDDNAKLGADIVNEQMAADVLSDQLTDNVLMIAHNNRRSATAAQLYFDTNLLYPKQQKQIKKGTPAPNTETEVCEIVYSPGKITHIFNKGIAALIFGMKLNGDKVGETVTVAPGAKVSVPYSYYFFNGTSFYVKNGSDSNGIYQFTITM